MWFKNIFILFFVSVLTCNFAFSQEPVVKTDSTHLYENIEAYSKTEQVYQVYVWAVF